MRSQALRTALRSAAVAAERPRHGLPTPNCCTPLAGPSSLPRRSISTSVTRHDVGDSHMEAKRLRKMVRAMETQDPSSEAGSFALAASSSNSNSSSTGDLGPSSSAKGKAKESSAPPPLSRPLGIPLRPVASPKTYVLKDTSLERLKEQREYLVREANRGYFHDYARASKTGAKAWSAPKVLIREDRALYMPNIAGTNLLGKSVNTTELCEGKVTLIGFTSTQLAGEQVMGYAEPVLKDQEGRKGFNYVEINHQQNQLKAVLVSMFTSSLKRQVPEHRWPTYFLSRGEWSYLDVSGPLGYENKIIGYIYLVDSNCKIRWAGCSGATEDEVQSLRTATEVLMKRVGEGK